MDIAVQGEACENTPGLLRAFLASELCEQPVKTNVKIDVRQEHKKEKGIMSQSKS